MIRKERKTIAQELFDRTQNHIRKQQQTIAVRQQDVTTQKSEQNPSKKFEPTPQFAAVFTEQIGRKTRPGLNLKLRENPRLIALAAKCTPECLDSETEKQAQRHIDKSPPQLAKKREPTPKFFKVLSGVIGEHQP